MTLMPLNKMCQCDAWLLSYENGHKFFEWHATRHTKLAVEPARNLASAPGGDVPWVAAVPRRRILRVSGIFVHCLVSIWPCGCLFGVRLTAEVRKGYLGLLQGSPLFVRYSSGDWITQRTQTPIHLLLKFCKHYTQLFATVDVQQQNCIHDLQ